MDKIQFWQNFNLGKELQIAGTFLYNGFHAFNTMDAFGSTDETFEVLYNLSVGFERLLKIQVALNEVDEKTNLEDFEKSLITHNHSKLVNRIRKCQDFKLFALHNELLCVFSKFYKSHRYNRFQVSSVYDSEPELEVFQSFFVKHLKLNLPANPSLFSLPITWREKRFLGKTAGLIISKLYDLITKSAREKNLYTYEVNSGTKAYKIFLMKDFDFFKEEIFTKEILVYLINSDEKNADLKLLKDIEKLHFDPALIHDYICALSSDKKKLWCLDELESIYDDLENKSKRLDLLESIGTSRIYFEENEENDA